MKELDQLKTYLLSNSSESAKRQFVYPIFQKIYKRKFKTESDAEGADGYVNGKLLIELKSKSEDWLAGFYQGLHYLKKGLSFPHICVISHHFLGLWRISDIDNEIKEIAELSDPLKAPNEIGRINSNKTKNYLKQKLINKNTFLLMDADFGDLFGRDIDIELSSFINNLRNLESERTQINKRNFIDNVYFLTKFFDDPLEAIHCFYGIIGSWDATSTVAIREERNEVSVVGMKGSKLSETIKLKKENHLSFKNYIEQRYIFTNEGSGLTADYYFSRFDEVISKLKPKYAREHGIYFTDHNLSKFALWFVRNYYERKLSDNYYVFDPAGGSGNLVTSWHGHLKHKIVSELEPDLLKTVEKRMKLDDYHKGKFTVIPKTVTNEGLNFLNKSSEDYLNEIKNVLNEKNLKLDKPLAFLLNPPYKNTDENKKFLIEHNADYEIHQSILDVTGNDAGKERYLAFLGQILNICKDQNNKNNELKPIIMIFTPTSWLIPRSTYKKFRTEFDKYFKYEKGFIITSNEFFTVPGKWPLAFTIWSFDKDENRVNKVNVSDYTYFKKENLNINWDDRLKNIKSNIDSIIKKTKTINLSAKRKDIRRALPKIQRDNKIIEQPRYNMYRNKRKSEKDKTIISGFPLMDERHYNYKVPYGFANEKYIGFMDNNTPVRLSQDTCCRMSDKPDRVWFMLMSSLSKINLSQIHSGAANSRSFCAYDLNSSIVLFQWFSLSKALINSYPLWSNQFEIWKPKISKEKENEFYSLCFAFGLAENRCVVTKFEKDNPVIGAPEVFVDNPLSTNNPESFWNTTLNNYNTSNTNLAYALVRSVKDLYNFWLSEYCPSGNLYNVGLKEEPYFKYFDYEDFVTKDSGLIQIKKYAEKFHKQDLLEMFDIISEKTKLVKQEIYRLLVEEFNYFA